MDWTYDNIWPEDVAETVRVLLVITYAAASTLSEGERLAMRAAHRVSVDWHDPWDTFVTHAYDQTSKQLNNIKLAPNRFGIVDLYRLHGLYGYQ